MLLTTYSVLITIAWIGTNIYILINSRKIRFLKDVTDSSNASWPGVAIIVAVKDEEAEVEAALTSILNLEYSHFRIIVVNDRSTDGTGVILAKMAVENP